jgi:hypothetical protein
MPIIITVHMANVKNPSADDRGMSIVMPISVIIRSCAMDEDISRSR